MQFYNQSTIIDSLEKKILNTNVYSKCLLRSSLQSNRLQNTNLVVDTNSIFYSIPANLKYFRRIFFKKKKNYVGYSVILDVFVYKRKKISETFKFYSFNSQKVSFINLYLEKLQSLRSTRKVFIFLRVKKGGFVCLFNGIKGFLPRRHMAKCLLNNPASSINSGVNFALLGGVDSFNKKKVLRVNSVPPTFLSLLNLFSTTLNLHDSSRKFRLNSSLSDAGFINLNFNKLLCFVTTKNFSSDKNISKKLMKLVSLVSNNEKILPKQLFSFVYFSLKPMSRQKYSKKKKKASKKKRMFSKSFSFRLVFLSSLRSKKI